MISATTNHLLKVSVIAFFIPHSTRAFPSVVSTEELNALRLKGSISKWRSVIQNQNIETPRPISKAELQKVSQSSFSSTDYFEDLLRESKMSSSSSTSSVESNTIAISGASVSFAAFILPQLDFDQTLKNTLGLTCLLLPFVLFAFFSQAKLPSLPRSSSQEATLLDRISYHEAAHVICGYLCGILISDYSLLSSSGQGNDVDIGNAIVIETPMDGSESDIPIPLSSILIIAVSGLVGESLRCGDAKGGVQDISVALEAMRMRKIPSKDREGLLRWAVMKSLILLRQHRDELDCIASAMRRGESLRYCYLACMEGKPMESEVKEREIQLQS